MKKNIMKVEDIDDMLNDIIINMSFNGVEINCSICGNKLGKGKNCDGCNYFNKYKK